nr:unnamed protein product [Haemonchus contortus]
MHRNLAVVIYVLLLTPQLHCLRGYKLSRLFDAFRRRSCASFAPHNLCMQVAVHGDELAEVHIGVGER